MKNICYLIFSLSVLTCKSSEVNDNTKVRDGYKENLEFVLKDTSQKIDARKIEFTIPVTAEESLIYFSSDYEKGLTARFQSLLERTKSLCLAGNTQILKKYLNLSEFVDGYFAEDYFDSIESIIKAQANLTCSLLAKSDPIKTSRLQEVKNRYCK